MISAERLEELTLHAAVLATTWNERLPKEPYWRDLAECLRELESARARISELEAEKSQWANHVLVPIDEHDRMEEELEHLRAWGLSQEDRDACSAGADALTSTHPSCSPQQQQAAILRRLGAQ